MRILIVDDHAVVRQGLQRILSKAYPEAVFREVGSAEQLLHCLHEAEWDLVMLDIGLPGRSGLEVLQDVRQRWPRLPVLVLSVYSEQQYAVRVLKAGGSGYVTKDRAPEELIQAVRCVLSGHKYVSLEMADTLVSALEAEPERAPHEALSGREYQVLCRLAKGQKGTQIAQELSLSVQSISTYRTRILQKLNLENTAELTLYALKHGLVM